MKLHIKETDEKKGLPVNMPNTLQYEPSRTLGRPCPLNWVTIFLYSTYSYRLHVFVCLPDTMQSRLAEDKSTATLP